MAANWVKLILLASVTVQSSNTESSHPMPSAQNRLLQDLLGKYGYTTMRPVYNMSNPTTVELMLLLTQVIELSERHQTIEIGAWITQRWTDEYMTWNPDDYDGIDHVYVHKSMIWLPDITLYKNVDRNFESYKDISVYIRSTGVATWTTPAILKCSCLIDVRLFPFDTQVCKFRFSSWAYDITDINVTEYREHLRQSYYADIGVWELLKVTNVRTETPYGDGNYAILSYSIYLRRRPMFHVLQIILPCVLLSLLNLMVFVLPPESGEKISLGVTNLLSLVLFQQLISGSVPPTSDKAPIIGYYFTPMIALACTSIVCTVAVLNVFYRDTRRPIPRWVRYITYDLLARLVCHRTHAETSPKTIRYRPDRKKFQVSREPRSIETGCGLTDHSETGTDSKASPTAKPLNSPAERARRQEHAETETGQEQDQTGKIQRSPTWQEVALVMDRTALVLSSVITLGSVLTTIFSFIVHFQEPDY